MVPSVTSYTGLPIRTFDSVDFPEPLGPIIAWTSPGLISKLIPFKIGVSSTFACKFVIFNISTMLIINKNKQDSIRKI